MHDEDTHAEHEKFSLPLFLLTVGITLAGLFAVLRISAPAVWHTQFQATAAHAVAAFIAVSLVNCFVEYFFHRYVLHTPAVPLLRRLYRQHTLHHALTRVGKRSTKGGRGVLFIENKFPIVEPEQGEASFFPWYSLAVFAAILTPLLVVLQWLLPAFPWFLSGFSALAVSLLLYEVLHAINHWSFDRWMPLLEHRRWGGFWRKLYGFHLRHHAVIDCNESISGFFGFPLADWVFGTCVIPKTIYADGEEWASQKFESPRPITLVRRMDTWAQRVVQSHRAEKAARTADAETAESGSGLRPYTRAEAIANWITHGIGLAFSILSLTTLIVYSSLHGGTWHVVSFTVFGLTLLTMYTTLTIYDAVRRSKAKTFFEKLTHATVFLLIAGTYTPFLLTHLRGPLGWTLFGAVWGLCGAAAVFQVLFGTRYQGVMTAAFVFVGWLVVVAIKPLAENVSPDALWLLLAGGLCYAAGAVFARIRQMRFHAAVWHTLLVAGSTCHYLAVLLFLLPSNS